VMTTCASARRHGAPHDSQLYAALAPHGHLHHRSPGTRIPAKRPRGRWNRRGPDDHGQFQPVHVARSGRAANGADLGRAAERSGRASLAADGDAVPSIFRQTRPFARRGDLISCPFALLDTDALFGFGPETITISQRFPGTYMYAVHRFSDDPPTLAGARVEVFDSTGLIATFTAPTEGTGEWWHVLTIDGATG